ncbi:L-2-amino-thiazoline-4-carboxylic acid hydrolase [Maridesulfovibrio salexigens]|uniref:L-2-amino-thiazoline-4-carboxylic acid hydrolase n=1 Tax=Maridesulfovibrio salexigens (strain ATCC 14822 / DSM 2638 / NCIMB 8403 / VKM B-1763) TaxID=526222 RepID=C6BUE9_MARSD|nr:L-2-amino-thiazoline-4-carboxylic acid hydrolase [Maridesulfovibrio salexigens]ACS79958.1 L-2-amino-thiazoline-4-carboxylic acid hydrolase [Maridesulfovibrio salexigens DSM 2638]
MKVQPVSQISRRLIEAELYDELYATMSEQFGKEQALKVITENLQKSARKAGQSFAASVDTPNLEHFATVVEIWKKDDAIEVADISINGNELTIKVTRCRYQESYREMGLPEELCTLLSCSRDEPFAKGYSDKLSMIRETTLAEGGDCCPFKFIWG